MQFPLKHVQPWYQKHKKRGVSVSDFENEEYIEVRHLVIYLHTNVLESCSSSIAPSSEPFIFVFQLKLITKRQNQNMKSIRAEM